MIKPTKLLLCTAKTDQTRQMLGTVKLFCHTHPGADPGYLERVFICINVWGVRLADFISFFLNIP